MKIDGAYTADMRMDKVSNIIAKPSTPKEIDSIIIRFFFTI